MNGERISYGELVVRNRNLQQTVKDLRASLKVAEKQNEIDATKISHLVDKLEQCGKQNDEERHAELLRTIERLNRRETELEGQLEKLEAEHAQLQNGFNAQGSLMTRLDRKHQYQYDERVKLERRCEILQETIDKLEQAGLEVERKPFRDIMERKAGE